MREIFIFAVAASLTGTVFFVSLIELFFTVKRRRANHELQEKVKELKAQYNASLNNVVLEDEKKLEASEQQTEETKKHLEEEKKKLESEFEAKIETLTEQSEKSLRSAKERAKKLEQEAKLKAAEYLESRQKEVEEDLMNLVMSVSRKVLPEGISYSAQKELVLKALRQVKEDNDRSQ